MHTTDSEVIFRNRHINISAEKIYIFITVCHFLNTFVFFISCVSKTPMSALYLTIMA